MSSPSPITSMQQAERVLARFYRISGKGNGSKAERMKCLMAHLGNPERELKAVHVAGTSGKTSTSYFAAALLQTTGAQVGLIVSPHVDTVRERIQLNGKPVEEQAFCTYLSTFLATIETMPFVPTWAECVAGIAFLIFKESGVDYAVIETKVGGLNDGSNVLTNPDKVCIITDIGFDHMKILGDTLEKIAHQKAGIIHPGNHAIMYDQGAEITDVVKRYAETQGATLTLYDQTALQHAYPGMLSTSIPSFQRRNWLLAHEAFCYIVQRDDLHKAPENAIANTQILQVPGRMDVATVRNKEVIMDGAHNGQKICTFVSSYISRYGTVKVPVLFAIKQSKEVEDIAPLIASIASEVIITTFSKIQDLPMKSLAPGTIAHMFADHDFTNVRTITDQDEAYEAFLAALDTRGIITGSFFLLGELRKNHKELVAK